MNSSPSIRIADAQDPRTRALLHALRDSALAVDGQSAFNDQSLADLTASRRQLLIVEHSNADRNLPTVSGLLGAAILGDGELEFVIEPARRREGLGRLLLEEVLAEHSGDLLAWSHGDHPGARVLAAQKQFTPVRTLLQLRRERSAAPTETMTPDPTITAFRPGRDEQSWLTLNALAFADHPEQGRLNRADLEARMAEDWFSAENFLLAHGPNDELVGFNWLKVEPKIPHTGEIYAIGVHPDSSGKGVGRRLMDAGLARLDAIGATSASLYVEADNTPAVALYRSLGFTEHTIDVQYLRTRG